MTSRRTPSAPPAFTTRDTRRQSVIFHDVLAPHRRRSAISPGRASGFRHQCDRPAGHRPGAQALLAVLSAIAKDARLCRRVRGDDGPNRARSPRLKPQSPRLACVDPCVEPRDWHAPWVRRGHGPGRALRQRSRDSCVRRDMSWRAPHRAIDGPASGSMRDAAPSCCKPAVVLVAP